MPSPATNLLGTGPLMQTGLGLGSNIGDKPGNIRRALALIEERGIIRLTAVSSIYRTPPWGYVEQDFFANACAIGQTCLPPLELLAAIHAIEKDMGRQPSVRWGPRLIDIDILFHGDAAFVHAQLNLPHKNLFERAFVLVPLAEIAPSLIIAGRSVATAAADFAREPIEKWEEANR
ncbi:MAG TPA: 2-amino-4-hydroxy-6-hydroxymethyldihydropteridine diphosphokinase [Methylocella sp.]|nr:2-amino-4-hydroxy-6-hydroxymethyldihydropteridine diphosphokinase [Methylocella sp.]